MRVLSAFAFVLVCLAGWSPPPTVTKGTFDKSYTLTMQRGSYLVVVETSGPATYTITNYAMEHPMGSRPDTEAVFTTPAGTFRVSDRGVKERGVNINDTFYPVPQSSSDELSVVIIDANGNITAAVKPRKDVIPTDTKP